MQPKPLGQRLDDARSALERANTRQELALDQAAEARFAYDSEAVGVERISEEVLLLEQTIAAQSPSTSPTASAQPQSIVEVANNVKTGLESLYHGIQSQYSDMDPEGQYQQAFMKLKEVCDFFEASVAVDVSRAAAHAVPLPGDDDEQMDTPGAASSGAQQQQEPPPMSDTEYNTMVRRRCTSKRPAPVPLLTETSAAVADPYL